MNSNTLALSCVNMEAWKGEIRERPTRKESSGILGVCDERTVRIA